MNRKISFGTAVVLMIMTAVVVFGITFVNSQNYFNERLGEYSENIELFSKLKKIDDIVKEKYIGEIDKDAITDAIISGYMSGLGDKYGMYLDAKDYKTLTDALSDTYEGIGVSVIEDSQTGYIRVISVTADSPAGKNGVLVGDLIVKVEGEDVLELGYYEAVSWMQGTSGTVANFTVKRGEELIDFSLVREKYDADSVTGRMLTSEIGLIRISQFASSTPDEFNSVLNSLISSGAEKIIFDVRYNPGGTLESICEVLDRILPEGPIVRIVDKSGEETVKYSDAKELDMLIAVLINGQTISAAELFSAAIRDYAKGTLVGETTYGKGTVQEIIPLGDGTALDLSVSLYLPPTGDNYEGVGVSPDIEIKMPSDLSARFYELSDAEDVQLQKAIELLSGS